VSAFAGLDPCVHCGFCLSACPTYLATGDEADSPRGRIVLMRALEHGEIPATDPALNTHLDACLGCRGCEPACPSGVAYGQGLEAARALLVARRGLPAKARVMLTVLARGWLRRPLLAMARWIRGMGRIRGSRPGSPGFALGMLAATRPVTSASADAADGIEPGLGTVALFRGCVMDGLFGHVHAATRRVLEANGYRVVEAEGQVCCGALHLHAGDTGAARRLAEMNLAAFLPETDWIVVNSAGCGAMLRELPHLLDVPAAGRFSSRVRDVSELLSAAGPRQGGTLPFRVLYDAPCHLQHAQGVHAEVLQMLGAVPGLDLVPHEGADECCGSAGIYSILQPGMSEAVLDRKLDAIRAVDPPSDFVLTGNPGCLMQIGAGLQSAGLRTRVAHPVEVLDWSYRAAGYYGTPKHHVHPGAKAGHG